MSFQEFCKAAGAAQPTQGLGFAYNYVVAITRVLEDSLCDEPAHFSIKNGACVVTCRSDLLDISHDRLKKLLNALKEATHLEIRRNGEDVVLAVTFRI